MLCLESVTEDRGNADNDKKNYHYTTKRQSSGVGHETARAQTHCHCQFNTDTTLTTLGYSLHNVSVLQGYACKSTDLVLVSGKQSSKAPAPATVASSQDGSVTLRLVRQPETQHRAR